MYLQGGGGQRPGSGVLDAISAPAREPSCPQRPFCDDCTTPITLPFTFNFYGQPFTSVNASSNGNLQFTSNNTAFTNADNAFSAKQTFAPASNAAASVKSEIFLFT